MEVMTMKTDKNFSLLLIQSYQTALKDFKRNNDHKLHRLPLWWYFDILTNPIQIFFKTSRKFRPTEPLTAEMFQMLDDNSTHLVVVVTQSPAEFVVVHAGFVLAGAP